MEKPEVAVQRGLTWKSITISVVLIIVYTYLNVWWGAAYHGNGWAAPSMGNLVSYGAPGVRVFGTESRFNGQWPVWEIAFFGFFVMGILLSMTPRKILTVGERAFIMSTFAAGLFLGTMLGPNQWIRFAWSEIPQRPDWPEYTSMLKEQFPWLYLPNLITAANVVTGFTPDASIWTPIFILTAYWTAYCLMIMIFLLFFRRSWVEVEVLPFPNVSGANLLIQGASSDAKTPLIRDKWMWIGMLLGIVLTTYTYLSLIPGMDPMIIQRLAFIDLTPYQVLQNAFLQLEWMPGAIGFATFMPLNFLTSFVFFVILIFIILPPIMTTVGLLPIRTPGTSGPTVIGVLANGYGTTWYGWSFVVFGAIIAAFVITVWKHRSALSFKEQSKSQKLEMKEPFSKMVLWIGFIICLVVVLVMNFALMHGNPTILIQQILMMIVFWFVFVRLRAESGNFGGGTWYEHMWFHTSGPGLSFDYIIRSQLILTRGGMQEWIGNYNYGYGLGWGCVSGFTAAPVLLESMKLADMNKTERRDMWWAVVLGWTLTLFVGLAFATYRVAAVGGQWGNKIFMQRQVGSLYAQMTYVARYAYIAPEAWRNVWYGFPKTIPAWGNLDMFAYHWALGFAIFAVLAFVAPRFPRLPLSPHAFLLVLILIGGEGALGVMLLPSIIALIIKYVSIKVAGPRVVEEKLTPLAVGLILADGLAIVVDRIHILAVLGPQFGWR